MNVSHPRDPRAWESWKVDPRGPTASECPKRKIIEVFTGKPEDPHEAYASWD